MKTSIAAMTAIALMAASGIALADTPTASSQQTAGQQQTASTNCRTAQAGNPATPQSAGDKSGTAPGNAGKTGWTNGIGGSFAGTSEHAASPGSPNQQPAVATGLDPTQNGGQGNGPAAC